MISSLIWLAFLIIVIAVVVVVVQRAAARPKAGSQPPVVQQPVVQQPVATSGLAPGWYPDQNDPTLMRYFDGRVWTSQTSANK